MNTFLKTLFSPVKAFNEVKTTDKFSVMSLIIVLLLMLVNLILMIPISEKVVAITFSSMTLPENQIDTLTQVAHKMRYLEVAGLEILYIIMLFFYALLFFLFVHIVKGKLTYKNAMQLIVYSYFIVTVGDLVNTAFLYIRGLDAITNIYENSLTGLNLLTSAEQVGATLYTFLSYFTPFQLAFVVLLSIGLKVFTELKYTKSLIISIILWLITILIPTLSAYISQLTVAKPGIM